MVFIADNDRGRTPGATPPRFPEFDVPRYACTAFYSHPWAWNEIGFLGPAYPRGYKNIGLDARESFEAADSMNDDPVPWAARAEAAKKKQAATLPRASL